MKISKNKVEVWNHRTAVINKIKLHYVEAGKGPLVILLHGFPEFWYSWRHQIPALADAGFHIIAMDMRGYNESDKPKGVNNYSTKALTDDVIGIIRHLGEKRATVVGHDWGGAIAWNVPMWYPEKVEKLIVLNSPHPSAFLREIKTFSQLLKSWYMFFFQIPWIPEALIRTGNFYILKQTFKNGTVRPNAFTEEDLRQYINAISKPLALTSGMNYYRSLFRRSPFKVKKEIHKIDVPTKLIWGECDQYLGISLTENLDRWVPNIDIEHIPNASHWVQIDAPEHVNKSMIDFLKK